MRYRVYQYGKNGKLLPSGKNTFEKKSSARKFAVNARRYKEVKRVVIRKVK